MYLETWCRFSGLLLTDYLRPVNKLSKPNSLHQPFHLPGPKLDVSSQLEFRPNQIVPLLADLLLRFLGGTLFYWVFLQTIPQSSTPSHSAAIPWQPLSFPILTTMLWPAYQSIWKIWYQSPGYLKKTKELRKQSPTDQKFVTEAAPLAGPIDPSNEAFISNLAATGSFFDSINKEAHKGIVNTTKAVVFNIPHRIPLPLVQPIVLNARQLPHELTCNSKSDVLVEIFAGLVPGCSASA